MFFKTKLQLIQGQAGYRPGTAEWLRNEKWVVIKFQAVYIGPVMTSPYARMYEFLGGMEDAPVMGRYQITTTDTGSNGSYVIGNYAPPQNKIWQYDQKYNIIRLGTLGEYTDRGEETNHQHEFKIVPDVELHHAFLAANGFMVGGGGWYGYGQGIVNTKSPTNQPFEDRPFYWTTLPN